MQLRAADVARLTQQQWTERLGVNPIVEFRGERYLRQRPDGACVFLLNDGRCQVHAEFGFDQKPIACQMFPFMFAPAMSAAQLGVSFACQSVVENKGELFKGQLPDAVRIALRGLPEVLQPVRALDLARGRRAESGEVERLTHRLVRWIESDAPLPVRLDGLAWIAQTLAAARLREIRAAQWRELVDLLFDALGAELPLHPTAPPSLRQRALLQSAIFARTEDPKPMSAGAPSRLFAVVSQLRRSRRWRTGRGAATVPAIGSAAASTVTFEQVWKVAAPSALDVRLSIDALITRWLRASIEGGRVWGSGYYGWSAIDGIAALSLCAAAVGWLARFEAARGARESVTLADVQSALRRIDRTAGRAPWLGRNTERLRLAFLLRDDGLRRLLRDHF